MDTSGLAFPKPRARVLDRAAYKLALNARGRAFRAAVWLRDGGRCRACNRLVRKTMALVPERGEIHHVQTRGAHPDKRYDVGNGLLLCCSCHRDPAVIALFRRP